MRQITLRKHIAFIRREWQWVALAIFLIAAFGVRFYVVNIYSLPPSEDLAGDLNVLNAYVKPDAVRPYMKFHSPPIYYFLIVLPSVTIFSTFPGLKVYDALLPTLIAIPFFLLSREIGEDKSGALIATSLFTFSEIYNEMMGWGGTLNLFGIFFMLFSAYFLVKTLRKSRLLDTILAGVFLSLVFGTHHLSAVYYLVAVVISAIILVVLKVFPFRQVVNQFALLLSVGGSLSLPYAYVYIYMVSNRVSIASQFVLSDWLSSLPVLYFSMGRSFPVLATIALLGISGFICTWRYRPRNLVVVPIAFLLAAIFLSGLLNPETIDRASYFIPIAIFSASAVFFQKVCHLLTEPDISRKLIALMLLLATTLILFEGAYVRLNGAIAYYHLVDDDAVSALDWIRKNTPRTATIFTNYASLGTWIEGYSERRALNPKPPGLIVTRPDYEDALAANRIDAGNYVIENGYLLISDYIPAGYDNPGIYVKRNDYYEPLLFLDDEHQIFSFIDESDIFVSNMLSANKTLDEVSLRPDLVAVTYRYDWSFGTILRQVKLSKEPRVFITYNITLVDSLVRELNLAQMIYSVNRVNGYTINDTDVTLEILTGRGSEFSVRLSPTGFGENSLNVVYDASVLPTAAFSLLGPASRMSITLEVEVASVSGSLSDVQFTSSADLIKASNVSYLLLDKNRYAQLIRFTEGFEKLIPVFENRRILILKLEN